MISIETHNLLSHKYGVKSRVLQICNFAKGKLRPGVLQICAGAARRAGPDSMLIVCQFVSVR